MNNDLIELLVDKFNYLNWPLMLIFLIRITLINNIFLGIFQWKRSLKKYNKNKINSKPKLSDFINRTVFKRSILRKRTFIIVIIGLTGIQLNYPLLLFYIICEFLILILKNPGLISSFIRFSKKKLKTQKRLIIKKINIKWGKH